MEPAAKPEENPMAFRCIKTIRSHAGHARFLAECEQDGENGYAIVGLIPRVTDIRSPYAYSPTDHVMRWNGSNVICRETAHKVYQIFEVPAHERLTDEDTAANVAVNRMTAARNAARLIA
jgi:hypothetical protein